MSRQNNKNSEISCFKFSSGNQYAPTRKAILSLVGNLPEQPNKEETQKISNSEGFSPRPFVFNFSIPTVHSYCPFVFNFSIPTVHSPCPFVSRFFIPTANTFCSFVSSLCVFIFKGSRPLSFCLFVFSLLFLSVSSLSIFFKYIERAFGLSTCVGKVPPRGCK